MSMHAAAVYFCPPPGEGLHGVRSKLEPLPLAAPGSHSSALLSDHCESSWRQLTVDTPASAEGLANFTYQMTVALLQRRGLTFKERIAMREQLGWKYSVRSSQTYGLLKHVLHNVS